MANLQPKKSPAECRHQRTFKREDGSQRSTKLYVTFQNMWQRCTNPNFKYWHLWGGKGVTVCDAWRDFDTFADWMLANGWKEGLSLDRINSEGNYCPENCQILTRAENCGKISTTPAKVAANRRNALLSGLKCAKRVRCIETGMIFPSGRIANDAVGAHQYGVNQACRSGKRCRGYHWEYVED